MNQKELYTGWVRAKKVYGQNPVHVQLVAKQMGVLAGEVIDYIIDNPTLVTTQEYTPASGFRNDLMGSEYSGLYISNVVAIPFLNSESIIKEGDSGGTIVVTIEGATFETAAGTSTNWTVDVGVTGLTFASVTKDSSTQCTLTFTGTAALGDITIMAENAAISASTDSDTMTFGITVKSLDYATILALANRVTNLETVVGAEGGETDLYDRIIALEAIGTTFNSIKPTAGEFTAAVAASKAFTIADGAPSDTNTVTIATTIYTFKTSLEGTPDAGVIWVLIDGINNSATNLYNAINGGAGSGTNYKYGAGAAAHTLVTATNDSAGVVTVTAKTKGAGTTGTQTGNFIDIAETCDNGSWAAGAVKLSGGVDGTVCSTGKILIGASTMAIIKAPTTISDSSGCELITYDA